MTVSPSVGFPDWQGYAQWGEGVLLHQPFSATPLNTANIFTGGLSAFAGVQLVVTPNSGTGTIKVTVYPPGGQPVNGRVWQWNLTVGGPSLSVLIPTWGQSIEVDAVNVLGAGNFAGTVSITAVNQQASKVEYQSNQNYINLGNQTIPASGELDANLPWIDNGIVNIMVNNVTAKQISQIQFELLASDGTWNVFALLDVNKTEPAFYSLALPGESVRLRLVNSTTVAITGVYIAVWTGSD